MTEQAARPVYGPLLAVTAAILLVLPFVTTFNDFLTAGALHLGVSGPLQAVVPTEVRMVVGVLTLIGVSAAAHSSEIVLHTNGYAQPLFISWNCIGWQSLALFLLSLVTGLRGGYPLASRLQVVLLGVGGTFFVNLIRIAAVCLIAASAGQVPAIVFHDYGGTLMVIAWLFAFWALAYRWILPVPTWVEP